MSFRPITDVIICARPKVRYFGAYPAGFLQRARDLIACGKDDPVAHICSGKVWDYKCGPACKGFSETHTHGLGKWDVTMDLDAELDPTFTGDARKLADYRRFFLECPQIQGILADPPYLEVFAAKYKVGAAVFPPADTIVKNSIDVLPIGGRIGILSLGWPRYPKLRARQIGLFGVVVGNGNLGRWFAVYEKTS